MAPTKPIAPPSLLGGRAPAVANPLLLPAVAAAPFSPALLLPAAPPQPHRTDSSAPTHTNREPKAIPLSLDSSSNASKSQTSPGPDEILDPISNVKLDDDDFDIESYYARLHAIPSLDASSDTQRKQSLVEESSFSEIDLNSPVATEPDLRDDGTSQNLGIASDLAQNLSQLPQVLPQVASTVFSSFSSMLSLGRGAVRSDQFAEALETVDACPPCYDIPSSSDESENVVIPLFNRDEFSVSSKNTATLAHGNIETRLEKDFEKNIVLNSNIDCQYISQNVGDKPPSLGSSNMFRMSSQKKKMYAQVPGLTLGDVNNSNVQGVNKFSENLKMPHNIPFSYSADDKSMNSMNFQPPLNNTATSESLQVIDQRNENTYVDQGSVFKPNETLYYESNTFSMVNRPHSATADPHEVLQPLTHPPPFTNIGIVNSQQIEPFSELLSNNSKNSFTESINESDHTSGKLKIGNNVLKPNESGDTNSNCTDEKVLKLNENYFYSTNPASKLTDNNGLSSDTANTSFLQNFPSNFSNQQTPFDETMLLNVEKISQEQIASTKVKLKSESYSNNSQFEQYENIENIQYPVFEKSNNIVAFKNVPNFSFENNAQNLDYSNAEIPVEPKLFNVTDFATNQTVPGANFLSSCNNSSITQSESTVPGNKFRLSSTNKRLKYYSGPIANDITPKSDSFFPPTIPPILNPNPHLNQSDAHEYQLVTNQQPKLSNNFGLSLSKLQSAVTSFFNPYQDSEFQNSADSADLTIKNKEENDFRPNNSNDTPTFFSTSLMSTNTVPCSQLEKSDTVSVLSFQNSDSVCVSSNQQPFPKMQFSSDSNAAMPWKFFDAPNGQSETDFFNTVVAEKQENQVDSLLHQTVEDNVTSCNTFSEIYPFSSSSFLNKQHSKSSDDIVQRNTPDVLNQPPIDSTFSANKHVPFQNLSATAVEDVSFHFENVSTDNKNLSLFSNVEKSTSNDFEKMTIVFDKMNINNSHQTNSYFDEFVIEPSDSSPNEVEKVELDDCQSNLYQNNILYQQEKNESIDDSTALNFSDQEEVLNLKSTSAFTPTSVFTPIENMSAHCEINSKHVDLSYENFLSNVICPDEPTPIPKAKNDFLDPVEVKESASDDNFEYNTFTKADQNSHQEKLIMPSFQKELNINNEVVTLFNNFERVETKFFDQVQNNDSLITQMKNQVIEKDSENPVHVYDPEDETTRADNEIKEIFSKVSFSTNLEENLSTFTESSYNNHQFDMNNLFVCNTGNESENELQISSFSSQDLNNYHPNECVDLVNNLDGKSYFVKTNSPVLEVKSYDFSQDSSFNNTVYEKNDLTANSCETLDFNFTNTSSVNVLTSNQNIPIDTGCSDFQKQLIDSSSNGSGVSNQCSAIFDNEISVNQISDSICSNSKIYDSFVSNSTISSEIVTSKPNEHKEDKESIPLFNYFSLMQSSASNDLNL